jgi:hypothetical protein
MQVTRRERLTGYAEHLLDIYLGLRGKYAVLEPMLFDRDTIDEWGTGRRGRGFQILTNTLLMSCVLDISKIALDSDDRSPSLSLLVDALDEEQVLAELKEEYAVWHLAPTVGEESEVIALLQNSERREEDERRQKFDLHVAELRERWGRLRDLEVLRSFRTVRDKLLAHTELHHDGSGYRQLDVATLGLKYGDLKRVITELEDLLELVGLVFRSASFDFSMLERQLAAARDAFWTPAS